MTMLFLLLVVGFPTHVASFRGLQNDCGASMLSVQEDLLTFTGSNVNAAEDVLSCTASFRNVVFYQFMSTGARYRISTCRSDFATDLAVGTGVCLDVGCSNVGSFPDDECDTPAMAVEFFSEENELYTIAVTGNDTAVVGNFTLTLQRFARPANDECSGSETLQPSISSEPLVIASTENATANVLSCEAEEQVGVYYNFVGTGARFRVSTCHAETGFGSKLIVSDDSCLDIGCGTPYETIIDETNCDVARGTGDSMEFRSQEGVNYTIAVRGTGGLEDRGEFGLTLLEYIRPENDVCTKAVPIELTDGEALISGSTENATISEFSCYAEPYPTVFYEVVGTGGLLYVSSCFEPLFNTTILVNEGSCSGEFSACGSEVSLADFSCDPDMGYASTTVTQTTEGETYTIAVTGVVPSEKGDFTLQVQMGGDMFTPITNTTEGSSNDSGDNTDSGGTNNPSSGFCLVIVMLYMAANLG